VKRSRRNSSEHRIFWFASTDWVKVWGRNSLRPHSYLRLAYCPNSHPSLADWQSNMKKCCTNSKSGVTFLYRNQTYLDVIQASSLVFQADTDALLWYRVLSSQHSKFSQPSILGWLLFDSSRELLLMDCRLSSKDRNLPMELGFKLAPSLRSW
jgi:hypothetical protein